MRVHTWFLAGVCAGALALPPTLDALSLTLRGVDERDQQWVADTLRRKGEIAARTASPQILLVGGSNVNYGYSAAQIARELSIPATNLAVHAGLGRRYILWDCLRHVKAGDLAVLAFEYGLYGHAFRDPAERYQAFLRDRAYYEQLPWREQWILLGSLSPDDWVKLWSSKAGWRGPASWRDPMVLSERGDQTDNADPGVRPKEGPTIVEVVDPEFSAELRAFANAVRQRGADVVIVYPNLRDSEFQRRVTPQFVADLHTAAAAANVGIVGTPEESAFPGEYAYDTNYHLNAAGTTIATRRLVRQLREARIALPPTEAR